MTVVRELRERVADRYAALELPAWPDPHPYPYREATHDEAEYSRLTAPTRYRIVHVRARLWIACLTELPGVRATPMPSAGVGTPAVREGERGTMLTSAAPGTLPVYVVESDATVPTIRLAAGRPELADDPIPDCGCDACDRGSEDLLEAVDMSFGELLDGPVVLLAGDGWRARWFGAEDGRGGMSGDLDFGTVMGWCERLAAGHDAPLPAGTEALVGGRFTG